MKIEKTKSYLTEKSCILRDEEVAYKAATEEWTFFDDCGEAEATAYTIAYERTDCSEAGRPVLFAYNGGPGSSSAVIHLGALGPKRIKFGDAVSMDFMPPFEMEDNPDTILDICDIVLIDPVGCGYSRLMKNEAKHKYYSSDGDAIEIVQLMNKWLSSHDRWNAPLFVMGESYGTIRNALVADKIFYNEGTGLSSCNTLHLSGVVMLGTALDHGQTPFPVDTAVLNFSSIAASYWLHHQDGKPSLEDFTKEASEFAYREYLPALALGSRLEEGEKNHILERLEYFTGLDAETLLKLNLRVETKNYPLIGMAKEGYRLSRYDGRFKMDALEDISTYDMFGDDAISAMAMPAFVHCFNSMMKKELTIENDDLYDNLTMDVSESWDFHTMKPPVKCLESAMRKNPKMKVMFGTGYYDMVTTLGYTEYLVASHDLPKDRIQFEAYESGHMPYLGEVTAAKLGEDLHKFIQWACR
ncbi:hypothetical protein AALA22_04580 [Anaerovoracaceae bacterium 41-7]|uniref:Peptidase S10 n=1 Tax=Anaerotruncus colihominis TaxID=169435 RepID=A0A845QF77_9FIRM|nr:MULTISPECIES: hypothetical protein [Anaerotruncus]NBH60442.1 hypothetical protein [Anaerotruncus colihominis]NCF01096.1 hypothetical protein [Anaerotruncus sp. 80]